MKTRWIIAILLALLLVAGGVRTAQAVTVANGNSIPAGQTVDDDALLGGASVQMDGTVNGNLLAAGSTVTVTGTVKGDAILAGAQIVVSDQAVIDGNLFAFGSNVTVNGKVNGSIFSGSATLTLGETAAVGYNLYFGGYDLETQSGSKIGRDLMAAGFQTTLAGDCRNLSLAFSSVELDGNVSGDATIRVAEPGQTPSAFPGNNPSTWFYFPPARPSGLTISGNAHISGKLTYISPIDQGGAIKTTPGQGIVYQTPEPQDRFQPGRQQNPAPNNFFINTSTLWVWSLLRDLVTMILLGGLVVWLANGAFQRLVSAARQKPMQSAGMGLLGLVLAFFAFPIAALALILLALFFGLLTLVEVVGILLGLGFSVLGLAGLIFIILLGWAGKLVVAFIIGRWLLEKLNSPVASGRFWPLALGAVVMALLDAIPFLGWLITFVVALVGLGAVYYAWRMRKSS
jgi:hypothetical protein